MYLDIRLGSVDHSYGPQVWWILSKENWHSSYGQALIPLNYHLITHLVSVHIRMTHVFTTHAKGEGEVRLIVTGPLFFRATSIYILPSTFGLPYVYLYPHSSRIGVLFSSICVPVSIIRSCIMYLCILKWRWEIMSSLHDPAFYFWNSYTSRTLRNITCYFYKLALWPLISTKEWYISTETSCTSW